MSSNRMKRVGMIVMAGILVVLGVHRVGEYAKTLQSSEPEVMYERGTFSLETMESYENIVAENNFRQGTVQEYNSWMTAFVDNGGSPTSYTSNGMSTDRFFVATKDFGMRPLFGAYAIEVLVPEGIKFKGGALGHSKLYFMKKGGLSDAGIVTVYGDTDVKGVKTIVRNVMPSLRSATQSEYDRWVEIRGNEGQHHVNYNPGRFFVAKNDFELLPMYGASSITVLRPEGINVSGEDIGHNKVYTMR